MLVPSFNPQPTGRLIAAFLSGWVVFLLVCGLAVLPVVSLLPDYSAEVVGLAALFAAGLSLIGLRRALAAGQVRLQARDRAEPHRGAEVLRWVDVFADESPGFWEQIERAPDFARYVFDLRVHMVGFEETLDVRVWPDGTVVIDGPQGRVQALARHLIDAGVAHPTKE